MGRMMKHVSKSHQKRSPVSETLSRMSPQMSLETCRRYPRHLALDVSRDVNVYT